MPQAPANYYISAQSNRLFAFYPKFPAKGVLSKVTEENILEIEESSTDNRRQFDRRPVNIEIQFDGGDARGRATSRDIGIGGLYMATDARLPEGTPLLLRMNLGNQDLTLDGVVAYCDPGHGVGVRFHNLTPEIENILKTQVPST